MIQKKIILAGNTAWSMFNFRGKLIQKLVTSGFNVIILAPYDDIYTQKLIDLSVKFINITINPKGTSPIQDILLYLNYLKIFKYEKPDFIFFYTIKPNIFGSLAAQKNKIPHIAITTGLGYVFLTNSFVSKISKRLYKTAFKKTNQVWFLNNDDKQTFINNKLVDKNKTLVLKGEGINLDRFNVVSTTKINPVVFLLIARMLWDKGIGEFVDAARIIKKKYPDAKFQLLGFLGVENPSAIHKAQIDEWEAEGIVNYLGVTEDVKSFIDNATCIALPSYREGIPFTLLEASASGKPIITTDSIGCKETIEDGVTGFMCKARDALSLASCMEKIILLSPEEYNSMALAGRRKMKQEFDVNLIIKQYLDILDNLTREN